MLVIVESNGISAILIDSGCGDHRSAKIADNIFSDHFWIAEIWFSMDIEALLVMAVIFGFNFFKRRSDLVFQFIEKSSTESISKMVVVKMFYMTAEAVITVTAFGKEIVDVRIPFEVPAESMENHDITGSKIFGMVEVENMRDITLETKRKRQFRRERS